MAVPGPGDIGLTSISGQVGFLIRFGQWLNGDGFANYEHAFISIGDTSMVEAEPGGAVRRPVTDYPDAVYLRCPPQFGAAVAQAALELIGTPYSFLDYLALAAHRLHIPVPGLRGYISSTKHAMCSQLADLAASRGGWHLFSGVWPGYVTPGALHKLYDQQQQAAS